MVSLISTIFRTHLMETYNAKVFITALCKWREAMTRLFQNPAAANSLYYLCAGVTWPLANMFGYASSISLYLWSRYFLMRKQQWTSTIWHRRWRPTYCSPWRNWSRKRLAIPTSKVVYNVIFESSKSCDAVLANHSCCFAINKCPWGLDLW